MNKTDDQIEDDFYLNWLRTQPCCVCEAVGNGTVQDRYRGFGRVYEHYLIENNDYKTIPLCTNHSRKFDELSDKKWQEIYFLSKKHFVASAQVYLKKFYDENIDA